MHQASSLYPHLVWPLAFKTRSQPNQRSNSWQSTIIEQRLRLQDLLAESPSLKPYLQTEQARCYANARKLAAAETGLALTTFPEICPYPLTAVLTDSFLPN